MRAEEHYHIQDLIKAQEKRSYDRQFHRNRIKELEEREDLIKDAKTFIVTDFWCDKCKEDFKSQAVKQIEVDWSNTSQRKAFYKTKCWKGHWCIRLITDKFKDKFWQKSKSCALDRGRHAVDIIQSFETGYNLVYGKSK